MFIKTRSLISVNAYVFFGYVIHYTPSQESGSDLTDDNQTALISFNKRYSYLHIPTNSYGYSLMNPSRVNTLYLLTIKSSAIMQQMARNKHLVIKFFNDSNKAFLISQNLNGYLSTQLYQQYLYVPSKTQTVLPTSPSRMMILSALYSSGYIQSTISLIWVISRFFMKSLSNMAALINSRELKETKYSW